jgi:transposase
MSRTQCYEWFKRFKEGRTSVGEDPRPGRPSTSTDDDHVDRVRAVIRGNRLTVREVADKVGISIVSCHQMLTEKLQMRRVSAKFVPRLLTDAQKENRVEISQELLANANGNEYFLKNIITGDETWDYGYVDVGCVFLLERHCPL